MKPETIIKELLAYAGITINGPNPWDIQINDKRLYARIWRDKNLGLGESYMDGWWDCEQVDEFIYRLLRSGIDDQVRGNLSYLLCALPWLLLNRQSKGRARIIADCHYNLSNELFSAFLDPYMQYSCAWFEGTDDLEQAQLNKMEMICAKLELSPGDRLLDIGCGWGGLAKYAAERHGCTVTAVNISNEQIAFGRNFCKGLPVEFVDCDYRAINGSFDKIVSVGMFEHVGSRNYETYFDVVRRCLAPDGVFLLHTIGSNASGRRGGDPWISKYIFPNGMLPSIAQIAAVAENRFVIEDWHNLGPNYDKTLMAWHSRFLAVWSTLEGKLFDERFKRMWEYYLLSCAATFRARHTQVWQIVMTRIGSGRMPPSRCRVFQGDADCRMPS
jgi:cyclopropane-fatty-acyl-phospholipid synthase